MHLATHDELTGLPNRFFLSQNLGPTLADAARPGLSGVVLFVDLDGFKAVNDSLGHGYGDRLLVQVAQRLERVTRAGDMVARFGGDEFIVACPSTDVSSAQLAERIEHELSVPFELDAHIVTISASVGWAHVTEGVTPEALMAAADRVHVRSEGRAAYRVGDLHARHRRPADATCRRPTCQPLERNPRFLRQDHQVVAVDDLLGDLGG